MGIRNNSLGAKLRALRNERNLSQRDLSSIAGISANAISLIERDENSPSVATLQSLASALNVRMSYFFDDETGKHNVLHHKASERPAIGGQGTTIAGFGEHLEGQELEPFLITIEPGYGSGDRMVMHSGHEFVYCVRGELTYVIDYQEYTLEAGDFLVFEAHLPHRWINSGSENAELLLVLQTPGASLEPVQRHFINHPSIVHVR